MSKLTKKLELLYNWNDVVGIKCTISLSNNERRHPFNKLNSLSYLLLSHEVK